MNLKPNTPVLHFNTPFRSYASALACPEQSRRIGPSRASPLRLFERSAARGNFALHRVRPAHHFVPVCGGNPTKSLPSASFAFSAVKFFSLLVAALPRCALRGDQNQSLFTPELF